MNGRGQKALLVTVLGCAVFITVTTFQALFQHHETLPFYDQWVSVLAARQLDEGEFGLRELFQQHNEHRIAIPRLLFFVDLWCCAQRGYIACAMSCLVQLLHVALLVVLLRGSGVRGRTTVATVAGVLLAYQFAGLQIDNLIAPFQLQFVLVFLAASAAFAALAQTPASGQPWRWVAAAIGAGVVSTWSMANGLIVWPLLLVMGFQLRLSRALLFAIAVAAAEAIAWYFHGYVTPGDRYSLLGSLLQPHLLLRFVACYLGSPIRLPDGQPQFLAGATVAIVAALPFTAACRRLWRREAAPVFGHRLAIACIGVFTIGTATMTAMGRIRFDLIAATASRYATPVLLFWSSLLLMSMTVLGPRLQRLGLALAALVLVALVGSQVGALQYNIQYREGTRRRATALEVGVSDPESLGSLMSSFGNRIWNELAPYLAERHLSIFHERRGEILGRDLSALLHGGTAGTCIGGIDRAQIVPDTGWSFFASGWIEIGQPSMAATQLWFVDDRGIVVGLGDLGEDPAVIAGPHVPAAQQRVVFHGYGTVSAPGTPVRIFVRDAGGRMFEASARISLAAELAAGPGTRVAGIEVASDGAFEPLRKDLRPDLPADHEGVVVSSGAGTGEARMGPIVGVDRLAVPVFTGPSGFGITIELVDRQTRAVVRRLRPAPTRGAFRLWRIDVPADLRQIPLELVVRDEGSTSGQFVAVALPMRID